MKRDQLINEVIEVLENDEDLFNECIEELDAYTGYLGDDRYYEMDLLEDMLYGMGIIDILNMAYFGGDEDSWNDYSSFNPNREYFKFNGYGNLMASDYKDYSDRLDKVFIEALEYNRGQLYVIDENPELKELFDKLEG